jgi:hypothetical protein
MRRSVKSSILPELTVQSVWHDNSGPTSKALDARHAKLSKYLQLFNAAEKEGILRELLQIEAESLRRNNRLHYIRKTIMDLVDRKFSAKYMHHMLDSDLPGSKKAKTEHGSRYSLELAMADCEIQIAVLRAYGQGIYGDANKHDWFDQYAYLSDRYHAKLLIRNTGESEKPFYFDGTPLEPNKENFQICREKCLNAHVSQKFNLEPNSRNWLRRLFNKITKKSLWRKFIS